MFAVFELRHAEQSFEVRRREGDRIEVEALVLAVSLVAEEGVVLEREEHTIELTIGERARFALDSGECVLRLIAIRAIDARAMPGGSPLERELLAAIRAAPSDDAPRLVYADWLLSQPSLADRERGELVHVQCALARVTDAEQRRAIRARERELLATHPPPSLGQVRLELGWTRGFLEHCRGELEELARHATTAFDLAPMLGLLELVVSGWAVNQALVGRLATVGRMAQIRELSVVPAAGPRNGIADAVLVHVVPAMTSLRRLRLGPLGITLAGLQSLLGARACAQLAVLDLSGNAITVELARALADSRQLEPQILRLAGCSIGVRQIEALCAAPWLAELEELDLGDNLVLDAGATALARVPFKRLRTLALGSCEIGKVGGAALLGSHHLAKLRYLRLHKNAIGDRAAAALAKSRARSIEDLDLHACAIGEAGVHALAESANLRALRRWQLGGNPIGDAGALAIARSPHLHQLETLEAASCGIGDDGARALIETSIGRITLSTEGLDETVRAQLRERG